MAVRDSLNPSYNHDPFSLVGVSMYCSWAVNRAEWAPSANSASTRGWSEVKLAGGSGGGAVCRARATMSAGASASPGLSIWK